MQINTELLAAEIQDSINTVRANRACCHERFAIYNKGEVQVQILVTSDPAEKLHTIFPAIVDKEASNA